MNVAKLFVLGAALVMTFALPAMADTTTITGPHIFYAGTPEPAVQPGQARTITGYHEPVYIFYTAGLVPIQAPRWAEFCPGKYLTASDRQGMKIANAGPVPDTRRYREDEARYWETRRQEFEGQLSQCQSRNNPSNCYLQLRQIQELKNAEHQKALAGPPQAIGVPTLRCNGNGAGGFDCFHRW